MEETSVLGSDRRAVVVGIALAKTLSAPDSSEPSAQDRSTFYGVMDMVKGLLEKS